MKRYAEFSDDRRYRYTLHRMLENGLPGTVMFIGLNPSMADEIQDDPTIRRCIAFAAAWGYGNLCMVNLFAFRATEPQRMKDASDPVGEWNDDFLLQYARHAYVIVAAWGVHGAHLNRGLEVRLLLESRGHRLQCLGTTKDGQPRHPLYLQSAETPREWAA